MATLVAAISCTYVRYSAATFVSLLEMGLLGGLFSSPSMYRELLMIARRMTPSASVC